MGSAWVFAIGTFPIGLYFPFRGMESGKVESANNFIALFYKAFVCFLACVGDAFFGEIAVHTHLKGQ